MYILFYCIVWEYPGYIQQHYSAIAIKRASERWKKRKRRYERSEKLFALAFKADSNRLKASAQKKIFISLYLYKSKIHGFQTVK